MRHYVFLNIVFLLVLSCSKKEDVLITVTGPIPLSEIGTTLAHEHILVDFIGADSTGYQRWARQEVVDRALPFLEEIRDLGCSTFIDCTPAYVGRDPLLLKILSEKTGLNIVTNTGLYGAQKNKFIPARAFEMNEEEIASEWIEEFQNGIEDTGIKPGFIKIAVDRDDTLSTMHRKLIRAAGFTHLETGMVIKSHTGSDAPAFNQLAILKEMGVALDAFIWTHAQGGTAEGWIEAARLGAWISLDNINSKRIKSYLENLQKMKEAGLLDHVLISHDSGWYHAGEENGGKFNGYTVIFEEFIPALQENGFTETEIQKLIVHNPARAFCIAQMN